MQKNINTYENISKTHLNSDKSKAIKIENKKLPLSIGIQYTNEPVNYIEFIIADNGIKPIAIEHELIVKINKQINTLKAFNPTLKGNITIINNFEWQKFGTLPNSSHFRPSLLNQYPNLKMGLEKMIEN